jgi:hypothetical protein
VPPFIASRAEQFIAGSTADTEQRMIDHGKIKLARDEAAAIELSLRILEEMTDGETAKRTAGETGFPFVPAAAREGRR